MSLLLNKPLQVLVRSVLLGLLATACGLEESPTTRRIYREQLLTAVFSPVSDREEAGNPLTGFHQWRGVNLVPGQPPPREAYQRYFWRDLEPSEGAYQFGSLLNDLNSANAAGQAFAFRIRMMAGYDDGQRYYPDWLPAQPACTPASPCEWQAETNPATVEKTFVPNFNHPLVIDRAGKLLKALGAALPLGARISWIDIGMVGQYGEWALSVDYATAPAGVAAISEPSKRAYIDLHEQAFPERRLVMFALREHTDAIVYARSVTQARVPAGLRIDCLGRSSFMNQWTDHPADFQRISAFWKDAPFVAEFCGFPQSDTRNSFSDAVQQIRQFHITSVGNGNFGDNALPVSARFAALSQADREALETAGAAAGARLVVRELTGKLERLGRFVVTIRIENTGSAPLYGTFELVTRFRKADQPDYEYAHPFNFLAVTGPGDGVVSYETSHSFVETGRSGVYDVSWYIRDRSTRRKIRPSVTPLLADTTLAIGTFSL